MCIRRPGLDRIDPGIIGERFDVVVSTEMEISTNEAKIIPLCLESWCFHQIRVEDAIVVTVLSADGGIQQSI